MGLEYHFKDQNIINGPEKDDGHCCSHSMVVMSSISILAGPYSTLMKTNLLVQLNVINW